MVSSIWNQRRTENLPQAQKAVKQVLAMPYYGELEIESVVKICEIIKIISK